MTSPKRRLSALALASLTLAAAAGCTTQAQAPAANSPDTAIDTAAMDSAAIDTGAVDTAATSADASTAADATLAAVGSPCSAPGDCGTALFCLTPSTGALGKCVAYHTEGETCMIDSIPCVSGLICTNGAACYKPKTNAQDGESCHYDQCAPELLCVGLPQVAHCQAKGAEGEPCTNASPAGCKAGLVCGPDGNCAKS